MFESLVLSAILPALTAWPQEESKKKPVPLLYLEGFPRNDYRFLTHSLLKDPQYKLQVFLTSADKRWKHPASTGTTSLDRKGVLELLTEPNRLSKYKVILWGALHARAFSEHPDKQKIIAANLETYVEEGGGIIFHASWGYQFEDYPGSALRGLLPVRLAVWDETVRESEIQEAIEALGHELFSKREGAMKTLREIGIPALSHLRKITDSADPEIKVRSRTVIRQIKAVAGGEKPLQIRLTDKGKSHPATKAADASLWKNPPGIRWWLRGVTLREDAKVLVETKNEDPILIVQRRGKGRIALLATNDWWLWRKQGRYYSTYHKLIEWVSGQ